MKWVLPVLLLLYGCAGMPLPQDMPTIYPFVLLGPDGVPVARAITEAAHCPDIVIAGTARPLVTRMAAPTMPLRPTRSVPALSKPSSFR